MAGDAAGGACQRAALGAPGRALQPRHAARRPAADRAARSADLIRASASVPPRATRCRRSEEHTSELQSLMRISYAVFCLKKKTQATTEITITAASTL